MDSRGDTLTREKLHVKDTACSKTENKLSRRARMFQRKSRNASNLRQQMLSYFCYNASYSFIAVSVTIIREFFFIFVLCMTLIFICMSSYFCFILQQEMLLTSAEKFRFSAQRSWYQNSRAITLNTLQANQSVILTRNDWNAKPISIIRLSIGCKMHIFSLLKNKNHKGTTTQPN